MKNKFDYIELQLNKHPFISYALILFFYFMLRFFNIRVVDGDFSVLNYPIASIYYVNDILFPMGEINRALAKTIVSPCNGAFIYPSGIYLTMKYFGLTSISKLFMFLFLVQLCVPFLIFKLLRFVSSATVALGIALLSTKFFTNSSGTGPDWIIQPIMIVVVLLICMFRGARMQIVKLIIMGILCGLIMILKQNIGLFFIIVCLTWIFFRFLKFNNDPIHRSYNPLLFVVIAGYLSFGVIFSFKAPFKDEIIYYLFPYFIFWLAITCLTVKKKLFLHDMPVFFKEVTILTLSALLIPVSIFVWFGSVVGYSRYWYALFGMGFDYLVPMWDWWGIRGVILDNVNFEGLNNIYFSSTSIILFLFPFMVNILAVARLIYLIKNNRTGKPDELGNYLIVASMGIVGIFMFFPLESYSILVTKLFLYCFILFYILKSFFDKYAIYTKMVLIILVIPVALFAFYKPIKLYRMEKSFGSEKMQRIFGLPLEKKLAEEIENQISVVERSINDSQFYVIGGSCGWIAFKAYMDDGYPQFYTEMRDCLLRKEVTDAIIDSFRELPFVIVNLADYQKYLLNQEMNPFKYKIIDYAYKNFHEIDRYEAALASFVVMKNYQW